MINSSIWLCYICRSSKGLDAGMYCYIHGKSEFNRSTIQYLMDNYKLDRR